MSYELKQPYTDNQRADFIVKYNHNLRLQIKDTEIFLFALEANEIMGEKEIEIDVPDTIEVEVPVYDENGEEVSKEIVKQPVMEEIEEEIEVPVYDEETGEFLNFEKQIVKRKVQKTHKERIIVPYPVIDPDYKEKQEQKERERIANLSLTRGDVFEALILAKGLGKTQIRAMIEKAQLDEVTKALYLNRFDEALNFYRSYPIFDMLGQALGITSSQLDKFFDTATVEETKAEAYKYLTNVTFDVNTVPEEATVTINGTEGKNLTLPYGSRIEYSVTAEGYLPQNGEIDALTEDKAIIVELVKEIKEDEV